MFIIDNDTQSFNIDKMKKKNLKYSDFSVINLASLELTAGVGLFYFSFLPIFAQIFFCRPAKAMSLIRIQRYHVIRYILNIYSLDIYVPNLMDTGIRVLG